MQVSWWPSPGRRLAHLSSGVATQGTLGPRSATRSSAPRRSRDGRWWRVSFTQRRASEGPRPEPRSAAREPGQPWGEAPWEAPAGRPRRPCQCDQLRRVHREQRNTWWGKTTQGRARARLSLTLPRLLLYQVGIPSLLGLLPPPPFPGQTRLSHRASSHYSILKHLPQPPPSLLQPVFSGELDAASLYSMVSLDCPAH